MQSSSTRSSSTTMQTTLFTTRTAPTASPVFLRRLPNDGPADSPRARWRAAYQDDGSVGRSALVHASCYEDEIEHQKGRRC